MAFCDNELCFYHTPNYDPDTDSPAIEVRRMMSMPRRCGKTFMSSQDHGVKSKIVHRHRFVIDNVVYYYCDECFEAAKMGAEEL